MHFNKACELADFEDASFCSLMRDVFYRSTVMPPEWPIGRQDRKFWEMTMAISAAKLLEPRDRCLAIGVAAGVEATSFALTKVFQMVVATDLYGVSNWDKDAPRSMLSSPERYSAGIDFVPSRLATQYMSAQALVFDDCSADLVFSCSSIEHFGDEKAIAAAAAEMGRIVKRGGLLSISTELRIAGGSGFLNPYTYLFTEEAIDELIVKPSGCLPVDSPDYRVSSETTDKPTEFAAALRDLREFPNRLEGRWSSYPHIVIEEGPFRWTSAQILLRKPL